MTTITDPSFESGYAYWSPSHNNGGSSGTSTAGVTDGSKSVFAQLDALTDRPVGNYMTWKQSVNFTSNFILLFDYYDSASNVFDIAVFVDGDLIKNAQLAGSGQQYDESVTISGYAGTHDLKIGIRTNSITSLSGRVYLDNVRITNESTTAFYVKTTGNDALDGESWANAWATINKVATTVLDGTIVHIGFGTYNAEPANNDIAPVNAGAVGIKYLPETATTGGGTGSVIVEVN